MTAKFSVIIRSIAKRSPIARRPIEVDGFSSGGRKSSTTGNSTVSSSERQDSWPKERQKQRDDSSGILRGMLLVCGFLLVAKLVAAGKEIVVAAQFGVSEVVDAYQLSFSLTQWPIAFFGAAIVSTVVPLVSRQRFDSRSHREAVGRFFAYVLILGCVVCVLVVVGLPAIIRSGVFPFALDQQNRIVRMTVILGLAIPASLASRFFAGCAIAARTHLNTLFECLPAVMIITCLTMSSGENALVFGGFLGLLFQCAMLGFSIFLIGSLPTPQFSWPGKAEADVLRGCGALIAAHFLLGTVDIVDQVVASTLNSGSIATLGYANRVLALVLGLAATTICRSMFPVLATMSQTHDSRCVLTVLFWIGGVFVGAAVVAGGLAMYSGEIVKLIFERGAFMPEHTERVSAALRWGASRVPPYVLTMVLVYAITSQRCPQRLIALGCLICLSKIIAATVLTYYYGLTGLIVSSTIVYALAGVFGLWVFAHNKPSLIAPSG